MSPLRVVLLASFVILVFTVSASATSENLHVVGGPNWEEFLNEPPEVGDTALQTTWNQTDVETHTLAVSIGTMGEGFDPANTRIQVGAVVIFTNEDIDTHTVTDKDGRFDSFDIEPDESWEIILNDVGVYEYYCKHHPMMEGTITVLSDAQTDLQVRTDFIEVWTASSNLFFWANFSMSEHDTIEIVAQKKGHLINSSWSINLNDANGFRIENYSDGTIVGDYLSGDSNNEWKQYYIYLDSQKLGYNGLDYNPHEDNSFSFVFRVRGIEGYAAIGGVQLVRQLDKGFYFGKSDEGKLTYDIFPSLEVEIDYFAKNIGNTDNTFSINPGLVAQGNKDADVGDWEISINVMMNGETFEAITTTQNEDGTWTHEFDMAPDDEAILTVRVVAPDYNQDTGEPEGNRKFDVKLNAYDVGTSNELREPIQTALFIKPSQFVFHEIVFNKQQVLERESLEITAKVWNEGTYASDVLVVFYVLDKDGSMYSTPDGNQRMTRIASTIIPFMAPKPVMDNDGVYKTWYEATGVWDEAYLTKSETTQAYSSEIYAIVNPFPFEQIDIDAGLKPIDEYLSLKTDNTASASITIVKSESVSKDCLLGDSQIIFQMSISDCPNSQNLTFSLIASSDGTGVWTVQIVKINPHVSVNSVHWYLMDEGGNTMTDGTVSDIYGYYRGESKAVVFIDNDYSGTLSPGDKFEIYPGESGSDLEEVSDVTDFHLLVKLYSKNESLESPKDSGKELDEDNEKDVKPGTPTAIAGQDVRVELGGTVQFSGAGTDDDGSIVKYEWDFDGDGVYEWSSNENGLTTFIFNNAGTYTATLKVTDDDGKTATDSMKVSVKSPEEEGLLPSLSLLSVVATMSLLAILRRK